VRRRSFLAGLSALAPTISIAASLAPIVRTQHGRVLGRRESGVEIFLGIPYGADTRVSRFEAPRPPTPWRDVRPVLAYGDACPQRTEEGRQSEDCLHLNIWTPSADVRARRPVLVYLHGGEYSSGSGSSPLTDGARLAAHGDVVVLTLNHRLNIFGHLALAEIAGSGNAGLADILAALRWVGANIAAFGGDAGNVTLFGQSGGGAKIACLMAMPQARGLFHHVMTMSGQQITAQGPRAAAARTRTVFAALGLQEGDVAGLRALPTERLVEATRTADPSIGGSSLYFGPVLDGGLLPRHPFYPDAPPLSADIPMIIGNTLDETRGILRDPALLALTWDTLPARLQPALYVDISVEDVIARYRALYPAITPTDLFFAATTAGRSWRAALIEAELRAAQGSPVCMYQLNWRSPVEGGRWGAPHTLDIPLIFGTTHVADRANYAGDSAAARAVSLQMQDMLIAFARGQAPLWRPYTLPERATMMVDLESRIENDPRGEERRLFARVPYIQRGTY
jgi:para-nitrobenzyl esterase